MKDVIPHSSGYIAQNCYNTLPPLNILMGEYDNIIDERSQIESIEFEIAV